MFIDTSMLAEYLSGDQRVKDKIEEAEVVRASSITFFELFRGALRSDHSEHDVEVVDKKLDWIEKEGFQGEAVKEMAEIEKNLEDEGEKINLVDILIAAAARTQNSKLLTADNDFQKVDGLKVETL